MTRKIRVDLEELESAIVLTPAEAGNYLDLETGDVIMVTDETQSELNKIYDEIGDGPDGTKFEGALKQSRLPDWMKEALRSADLVEREFPVRFVTVPQIGSGEAYRTMVDFIVTVEDDRLRARLDRALDGSRPFHRFKDVLLDYPAERERWFQFEADAIRQLMLDWLPEEEIEPVPRAAQR